MDAETVAAIAAIENCTPVQTVKLLLAAEPMRFQSSPTWPIVSVNNTVPTCETTAVAAVSMSGRG